MIPICVLVVAKAPVPGLAKTRLAADIGDAAAADIAAAALLDTLDAVADAPVAARVVALTGELEQGVRSVEILRRLEDFTVITQRGEGFAERLANAHADAGAGGLPVLQIGMDTPQVSVGLLTECGRALLATDAVLGLARDGGWWVLGVRDSAMAGCLRTVPMSRPDTGALTLVALQDSGVEVDFVAPLNDVDTVADIDEVRRACAPDSRFARTTRGI
ncbi:DUF2064 domain-containing protein [Mycobacterium sp. 21AC1]|uniref:TIGR04282 family arsenosugar biosynthesis glycosyltransferase n=1 Tax=[Mycobacterium] appelbergii TaxID=2939269 RepID=UPI0029391FD1|nr:DUF2064 domain-containing protein [Mycobacterium sp. 21AC1]MDV3125516.1 DUF2064 domain-containing protein [Mycobacterium sp. 21AC1]